MPYEVRQVGSNWKPSDGVVVATAETAEELDWMIIPGGKLKLCWTSEWIEPKRWSDHARGSARRKRLRRRLDAKHPLLADTLYKETVLADRDYYEGKTHRRKA